MFLVWKHQFTSRQVKYLVKIVVVNPQHTCAFKALWPEFVRFPMCLRAIWSGFPTQIRADREVHQLSPFAGTEKNKQTKHFLVFWFCKATVPDFDGPAHPTYWNLRTLLRRCLKIKARSLIKTFRCGSGEKGGGTGVKSCEIIAAVHCCPLIFY